MPVTISCYKSFLICSLSVFSKRFNTTATFVRLFMPGFDSRRGLMHQTPTPPTEILSIVSRVAPQTVEWVRCCVRIQFVHRPLSRVVVNIRANPSQRGVVADNMIIVVALPNRPRHIVCRSRYCCFETADNRAQRLGLRLAEYSTCP